MSNSNENDPINPEMVNGLIDDLQSYISGEEDDLNQEQIEDLERYRLAFSEAIIRVDHATVQPVLTDINLSVEDNLDLDNQRYDRLTQGYASRRFDFYSSRDHVTKVKTTITDQLGFAEERTLNRKRAIINIIHDAIISTDEGDVEYAADVAAAITTHILLHEADRVALQAEFDYLLKSANMTIPASLIRRQESRYTSGSAYFNRHEVRKSSINIVVRDIYMILGDIRSHDDWYKFIEDISHCHTKAEDYYFAKSKNNDHDSSFDWMVETHLLNMLAEEIRSRADRMGLGRLYIDSIMTMICGDVWQYVTGGDDEDRA